MFEFRTKNIRSRLVGSVAMLALGTGGALAQSAAQDAPSPSPNPAATQAPPETVIVTGTLIARRDYETATPIISITPDALEDSGQVTLQTGLAQMPQFSAATSGSGPFIGGSGQANVDLRGLGAQRNLVLLDGRRMLPSSSDGTVDINQLPAGIVQSVEVITGGASATYGSDAVSGVVNFKTRQGFEGLDISTAIGTTQTYGGVNYDVNGVAGLNTPDGRGNLLFAVEYTKVTAINRDNIPFYNASVQNVPPLIQGDYNGASNSPSQAAINAYFAQFGAAPGTVPRTGNLGFNPDGSLFSEGPPAAVNFEPITDAEGRRLNDVTKGSVYNHSYYFEADVPLERWSTFTKGTYNLGHGMQFYGQALYTNYNSSIAGDGAVSTSNMVPMVPVTNPFIPAALQSLLATRAAPTAPFAIDKRFTSVGGYRTATNANGIYQFIAGINGVLPSDMTWDIYASHGATQTNYISTGGVRVSLIQDMLNASDGGASICPGGFNPFGNNPVSPQCQQYLAPEITNRTTITQDIVNASLQGDVMDLPAGKVQFALGADYRNIGYKYVPDSAIEANDVFGLPPQNPASGSSAVREGFGELLIPALKDLPFAQEVNLDLAYRYSDYVLSGGTNTYKGDIDWRVGSGVRLRGGYERAVRAPAVAELFEAQSAYVTDLPVINGVSDPCDVRSPQRMGGAGSQVAALCQAQGISSSLIGSYQTSNYQLNSVVSGNPNLKPEKADTFTGGIVYQPVIDSPWFSGASLSVDYYNIRIAQAISEISGVTVVDNCFNIDGQNPSYSTSNYYCGLIQRGSSGIVSTLTTPFVNLGGYKTSGIDFEADWNVDLSDAGFGKDAGKLVVNVVASYLNDFQIQVTQNTPFQQQAGTTLSTNGPFPDWRSVSHITYRNDDFDIGMRWRFIGAMEDSSIITNPLSTVPGPGSANYFDLLAGYTLPTTDTHLSLIVSNLFDRSPNQVGSTPGSTNAAVYSPLGRTYLLTIDQKF